MGVWSVFSNLLPPNSSFREATFPDGLYRKGEEQRRKSASFLLSCFLAFWGKLKQRSEGKPGYLWVSCVFQNRTGECQGHRVFLEWTVWYPKAQCLGWENHVCWHFVSLPGPGTYMRLGLNCLPLGNRACSWDSSTGSQGGRGQVCHLSICVLDTAVVGLMQVLWVLSTKIRLE